MKAILLNKFAATMCAALCWVGGSNAVASTSIDFDSDPAPNIINGGTIVSGDYSFQASSWMGVLTLDSGLGVSNGSNSFVFLNSSSLSIARATGNFSLSELDVGFTNGFLDSSEQLQITGHTTSGDVSLVVAQPPFSKTSFAKIATPGFTNLTSLTLTVLGDTSSPGYVAIDNLVVTAVPEPETYAMLLAGLGLTGFAARRRKAA